MSSSSDLRSAALATIDGWSITKAAKNVDQAYEFLKFIHSAEGSAMVAEGSGYNPVAKGAEALLSDKAKAINTHIKGLSLKGIQSSTQGDQVRVTGKKRDDLQAVIAALREHDFGIPLQFENFRD